MTSATGSAIPTLTTSRLRLRAPAMEDFDAYARLMASERAKYMNGPLDTAGAWGYFTSDVALWRLYGHGGLMIDLMETGETVGQVGINHGPLFPEKELGWLLYDGFEGKGFATEAATCMRDWAFETLGVKTLVSYVDPDNATSAAVALRMGAVRDDKAVRPAPAVVVYRHSSPG